MRSSRRLETSEEAAIIADPSKDNVPSRTYRHAGKTSPAGKM